jgi:hypothetical protein
MFRELLSFEDVKKICMYLVRVDTRHVLCICIIICQVKIVHKIKS